MRNYIKDNLASINSEIINAEKISRRLPGSVRLMAVSKNFPAVDIMAAYNAGHRMFGENKIQELEEKAPKLPKDIEWHLIGHLQSNKAVKAVELAEYIHSIDSEKLISRIDRLASERNKIQKILLEVNISEEESKFGLNLLNIDKCVKLALKSPNIKLVGFMTMAPFKAEESELIRIFYALKHLRDSIEIKYSISLPELSMGMSDDFKQAIECGSTIVRIGTAIFGRR